MHYDGTRFQRSHHIIDASTSKTHGPNTNFRRGGVGNVAIHSSNTHGTMETTLVAKATSSTPSKQTMDNNAEVSDNPIFHSVSMPESNKRVGK